MLLFYFYPRPPRGGRHSKYNDSLVGWMISIHALREEGDGRNFWRYRPTCTISIHALREEGDLFGFHVLNQADHISIHALREEGDLLS